MTDTFKDYIRLIEELKNNGTALNNLALSLDIEFEENLVTEEEYKILNDILNPLLDYYFS